MTSDTERARLAFLCTGILNTLEKCVSALRTGFLDNDYLETKRTIDRLKLETDEIADGVDKI